MATTTDTGLEALYSAHRGELLRFLTARTGSASEAEDLMQELWLKIPNASNAPIANGRAYLYRMAQNLVLDRRSESDRRQRRERSWWLDRTGDERDGMEPTDPARNAEETMLDREEAALLASAIGNLPQGARRVFELHKLQGMSHGEVAMELGISKSGVEKHMAVATRRLRQALTDCGFNGTVASDSHDA